jgi:hypothetical protein
METKFERRIVSNGQVFRLQIRAKVGGSTGDWTTLVVPDYATREEADAALARRNADAAEVWEPV